MSTHYDTATPYIASYVIFRKDTKVAFVLRENTKWMNGFYGLPSGKVEQNEPATQAAIREAKEEVGIDVAAENLRPVLVMHRKSEDSEWVDFIFESVSWEGDLINAEPHMHSKVEWLDPKNLPDNVIPPVRAAIEAIEAGQHYAEFGWPV
ncbi:MAG TPA: NUDIX domain-containing protein [Candidatus Saccharimonadales bacterium]|nr:NUDIX domain-containing protein [Candidatus Saccharimonadales bacterium]